MKHMDSSLFDWQAWRAGSIWEVFHIRHRTPAILANADVLREHAVGWCDATQIPCRPKIGNKAVMFAVEDRVFWTHLRAIEFDGIWGEHDGDSV